MFSGDVCARVCSFQLVATVSQYWPLGRPVMSIHWQSIEYLQGRRAAAGVAAKAVVMTLCRR